MERVNIFQQALCKYTVVLNPPPVTQGWVLTCSLIRKGLP